MAFISGHAVVSSVYETGAESNVVRAPPCQHCVVPIPDISLLMTIT